MAFRSDNATIADWTVRALIHVNGREAGVRPSGAEARKDRGEAEGIGAMEIAKRLKIGRASVYRTLGDAAA
ncbi:MAG TPA: helix-turn-helix domain-containing protein [Roseiarcus sp.]|nr:helix-turn-helix domain-containing protein [Roseiarcus sp.]